MHTSSQLNTSISLQAKHSMEKKSVSHSFEIMVISRWGLKIESDKQPRIFSFESGFAEKIQCDLIDSRSATTLSLRIADTVQRNCNYHESQFVDPLKNKTVGRVSRSLRDILYIGCYAFKCVSRRKNRPGKKNR